MKKNIFLIIVFLLSFSSLKAQSKEQVQNDLKLKFKTEKFKVYGVCGSCKKRIEKAVSEIEGVETGEWNVKSKILKVSFDPNVLTVKDISKKINESGYDTEFGKAPDKAYENLPGCCQNRKKAGK